MGACCLSRFFTMYILDVKYYRIYRSERGGQGYRNGKESENSANVIGRVKRRESIFKRRDSIPRNEIYSNSAHFLPFIVAERFLFAKIRRNPAMKYRKTPLRLNDRLRRSYFRRLSTSHRSHSPSSRNRAWNYV